MRTNGGSTNPNGDENPRRNSVSQTGAQSAPTGESFIVDEDYDHGCPDRCLLGPFNVEAPTPLD